MNEKAIPFYDMFSCCSDNDGMFSILKRANVLSAVVDEATGRMSLKIEFPEKPAPVILSLAQEAIADEFGLNKVSISAVCPPPDVKRNPAAKEKKTILMGKQIRGNVINISEITPDSGRVTVLGEVFDLETKTVRNGTARIVEFSMTDNCGSLRVTKFLREDEDTGILSVKEGMYIKAQGNVSYNRFYGDLSMDPTNIELEKKPMRTDKTEGLKRVELHMHSKMSALDAITDIKSIVKTAARWGHKAVAITDHGVCQAFPTIASAAKNEGIKVLFGVEAYYINDYDDKVVVMGSADAPLDGEFVAFDLETTGLDRAKERITEIGAVIVRNGTVIDRFQTMVNPGKKIPFEVVRLTGIRDEDVANAPGEEAAIQMFLDFAGDRPLCAHNAEFDMSFIESACKRNGLRCDNTYMDTVTLAQNLLPDLKRHTLDSLAEHYKLPAFNHHRASDDAVTLSHIMNELFKALKALGVTSLGKINGIMPPYRGVRGLNKRPVKHIIILVKEQAGLKNLYKLISYAHIDYFRKNPIIPKSLLIKHMDGLIIGSACENSELFKAVKEGKSDRELLRISEFYDYFEIQPVCNNMFMLNAGEVSDIEDLRDFNRKIVWLGEITGKPVVATGDVHFLEPEHEVFRRILISNKFQDADMPLPIYFKTTDEMLEEFSYLGTEKAYEVVVTNTNLIADMCGDIEPLPKKLYIPKIENSAQDLKNLVFGRMHELYGDKTPDIVYKRVETEMKDIIGCGYDVIYMSAQKLVARSLEAGYLVGSRGSVGSSVAAFLAGITEVNALPPHYRCPHCRHSDFESGAGFGSGVDMPDKSCPVCGELYVKDGFDIPFETFLGFGGDKVPDIDLNFSGEYQAVAHKETIDMFGREHVFRAGTIGGIAEKTAFGYVKKYMEERGLMVSKAEEARLAAGITGVKRTTGQHPGGLVVIPGDMEVYDFCPVQHPADSADSDIITTHYEYHSMEANLLKLDLLGHDDPSMLRMLEDLTGVHAKSVPLDDPETMSIFKSPKALGIEDDDQIIGRTGSIAVPEFGTKFTREMLIDTHPDTFAILVRLSGFSHGTDVWLGNAKELITSKTATVDQVIGCRDDIMIYLISLGMDAHEAFAIMEKVRKGRGLSDEWERDMKKLNVPEWYIESCKKIQYLFPKAHAVAYVMMAVRIAWYKVHRPLEFYCAYFTVRAPAFDIDVMTGGIDKVRKKIRELEFKPDIKPQEKDLQVSLEVCYEFYKRGFEFAEVNLYKSEAVRFKIEGNTLIPPFTAISGLGEGAAQDLVAAGKKSDFLSIDEIASYCPKVTKTNIEQLKKRGAFGDLPDSAQLSFF